MEYRICTSCNVKKCLTKDFYKQSEKRKHRSNGYLKQCKECVLERNRKTQLNPKQKHKIWKNKLQYRYGITADDYYNLLKKQNNSCAICNTKDPSNKSKNHKYFSVDHCHKTGKIRGLLCATCNSAIGLLGDCPQTLLNAVNYLTRP